MSSLNLEPARTALPAIDLMPRIVHADRGPQPDDLRIVKYAWGAFHGTGLDDALRGKGIDTVVLGGIATNFGVESTARVADEHGYRVVSVSDAMTGVHAHAHEFAIGYTLRALGPVVTTEEVLKELC
jgi:nicotinamidase-related amidase